MTFNTIAPNSGQSPALFPSQCNTNWVRIRENINNDHNFLNTTGLSQGIHKQCTMINRATPASLPAGNGILYSSNDSSGQSQLNWYNGANIQITPGVQLVTGSASLNAGQSVTIFADPLFAYTCTVSGGQDGVAGVVISGTAIHYSNNVNFVGATSALQPISYSGNNLELTNARTTGGAITFIWAIQVNRLP